MESSSFAVEMLKVNQLSLFIVHSVALKITQYLTQSINKFIMQAYSNHYKTQHNQKLQSRPNYTSPPQPNLNPPFPNPYNQVYSPYITPCLSFYGQYPPPTPLFAQQCPQCPPCNQPPKQINIPPPPIQNIPSDTYIQYFPYQKVITEMQKVEKIKKVPRQVKQRVKEKVKKIVKRPVEKIIYEEVPVQIVTEYDYEYKTQRKKYYIPQTINTQQVQYIPIQKSLLLTRKIIHYPQDQISTMIRSRTNQNSREIFTSTQPLTILNKNLAITKTLDKKVRLMARRQNDVNQSMYIFDTDYGKQIRFLDDGSCIGTDASLENYEVKLTDGSTLASYWHQQQKGMNRFIFHNVEDNSLVLTSNMDKLYLVTEVPNQNQIFDIY